MPSIRILICDLDGVIRHFDAHSQARVDTAYGQARGTIARIAFSNATSRLSAPLMPGQVLTHAGDEQAALARVSEQVEHVLADDSRQSLVMPDRHSSSETRPATAGRWA
jgi:hypothetical protein